MDREQVATAIVDAAVKVHTKLGPGLLESAYGACLAHELAKRRLLVKQQVPMPVLYEEAVIDIGYRLDMVVENEVVVELKAVEKLLPIHRAQLLSYLRLGDYRLGLLLNFNAIHMRDGISRIINSRTTAGAAVTR